MTPRRALLGAAAASLALAAAACRVRDEPAAAPPAAGSGSARAQAEAPAPILYQSGPRSFVELIRGTRHGVVGIRAAKPVRSGPAAMFPGAPEPTSDVALGTGFLVEAQGVFVLTTDQLAAASPELQVVLPDGKAVPAKVHGRDTDGLGIALLSIDVPRLQGLPLGDSDQIATGQWVVVLGNPFGDEVTASAGIVSATGREAASSYAAKGPLRYRGYLQIDARVHRGNSGGPVLDAGGLIVGLAVATGDRPQELSFAIPINRVRGALGQLREYGTVARSWLGVLVMPVTRELAQQLGLPKPAGAQVTELKAGSPASRSALRVGDVILRWGDREVDHRSLPWIIAETPPGRSVPLTVWRSRAEHEIPVVTEKMPE